jgi:subtilisin family serine protease
MVRADQVWSTYGLDGTGIVVGSMDTGFDPLHPALQGKWRGGANSWRDIVNGSPTPYDDNGHGTHTIGTMVGGDGPGPFTFDVGLAYNARFIAVKVLDAGNAFSSASTVIGGAQWILDPDANPATDDFPDVVNNSWLFNDPTFDGFLRAGRRGSLMIDAAGGRLYWVAGRPKTLMPYPEPVVYEFGPTGTLLNWTPGTGDFKGMMLEQPVRRKGAAATVEEARAWLRLPAR